MDNEYFGFFPSVNSLNDSIMENPLNDEFFNNFLGSRNYETALSISMPLPQKQFHLKDSSKINTINIEKKTNDIKTKKSTKKEKYNKKESQSKYFDSSIIKKIKSISLSKISEYLNYKIQKVYEGKIGRGVFEKQLKNLNKNQITNSKSDKEFIHKKLKDIFSDDISCKYSYYSKDHNKKLVENLLNEKNLEKRKIFQNLLSLTFLDCLSHIRGDKSFEPLKGIELLDTIIKQFDEDENYQNLFRYYILHYEEIVMKKREKKKVK